MYSMKYDRTRTVVDRCVHLWRFFKPPEGVMWSIIEYVHRPMHTRQHECYLKYKLHCVIIINIIHVYLCTGNKWKILNLPFFFVPLRVNVPRSAMYDRVSTMILFALFTNCTVLWSVLFIKYTVFYWRRLSIIIIIIIIRILNITLIHTKLYGQMSMTIYTVNCKCVVIWGHKLCKN